MPAAIDPARWWEHVRSRSVAGGHDGQCRIWLGALGGVGKKYPYARCRYVMVAIHRVAYEDFVGPIPPSYDVHHTCGETRRWAPHHLQAVPAVSHRNNRWTERTPH